MPYFLTLSGHSNYLKSLVLYRTLGVDPFCCGRDCVIDRVTMSAVEVTNHDLEAIAQFLAQYIVTGPVVRLRRCC